MKKSTFTHSRGYIALVSTLILSAIITIILFSSSMNVVWSRYAELDDEHAKEASANAYSCAYVALAAYAQDSTYRPNQQTVSIDAHNNCDIDSITIHGSTLTITTHASVQSSHKTITMSAHVTTGGFPDYVF